MKVSIAIFFSLVFIQFTAFGQNSLTGASIETTGSTTSTSFATVTGASVILDVTSVNNVMVIATFECKTSSGTANGSYQLTDGSTQSGIISRSLTDKSGVGSVVWIFDESSSSGNKTFSFQHLTSDGAITISTSVQLTAIALYDGAYQLNSDVKTLGSPVALPGTLGTALQSSTVTLTNSGGFYVAASIQNAKTAGGQNTVTGEWQLQYKLNSSGTWLDLSDAVSRTTTGQGYGVINLVGALPDNTPAGDYDFQVAHVLSAGADQVETQKCNLVVVALGTAGGFFPVTISEQSSISTSLTTPTDALSNLITPVANTNLFLHAQYGMQSTGTSDAPTYDLQVTGPSVSFNGLDINRYLSNFLDMGSAASSGFVTGLTATSTYEINLRHASTSGQTLTTSSIHMVGFGLTRAASFNTASKWKGTTSTDWNTASNWTNNAVPSSGSTIVFDETPLRHCILDQARTVNNIINNQSTYQLVTNGKVLTINGELIFTNGAEIDASAASSVVKFSGSAAQSILADVFVGDAVKYLTIDNAVGVTLDGDLTVDNDLTINSGKIFNIAPAKTLIVTGTTTNSAGNTGLVIKSDATGTGNLIHNTQNVYGIVERYLIGSVTNEPLHFISSPIVDASFSDIWTSGDYNVYWYDESNISSSLDDGWTRILSGTLVNGRGYAVVSDYDNRTMNIEGELTVAADILSVIPVTYTNNSSTADGWNLIGNPFPCAISAPSFLTDNVSDLDNTWSAIYYWDDGDGSITRSTDYSTRTISTGTAGSGAGSGAPGEAIPVGQGFFVKVKSGVSSLDLKASYRMANTSSQFFTPDLNQNFWLSVEGPEKLYNEIAITFAEDATKNHDHYYDAAKLRGNPLIALYSFVDNRNDQYVIQGRPNIEDEDVVKLGIFVGEDGSYAFKIKNTENFSDLLNVYLKDKFTGKITDLKDAGVYQVDLLKGEYNDRFLLIFRNGESTGIDDQQATLDAFAYKSSIYISEGCIGKIQVYDPLGKLIAEDEILNKESKVIDIPNYKGIVFVVMSNGIIAKKLLLN